MLVLIGGIGIAIVALLGAIVVLLVIRSPKEPARVAEGGSQGERAGSPQIAGIGPELDQKFQNLITKRRELKVRLDVDIPTLRNRLGAQAEDAKRSLRTASVAERARLEEELKEIARSELAAEKYEKDVRDLLSQLEGGARQVERLRTLADTHQESDEQLRAELDKMAQDIGAKLSVSLDRRIGAGPIEDLDLMARLDAIKNRKEAPQYVVVIPDNSSSVQAYTALPQAAMQGQIETLLETAKSNDNPANGKLAIAALNKILELNPTNAEARSLRQKVLRYYGPITLTVPLDFASIQQAIDAAQNGDVVVLKPGRYRESILMKEGVSLAGESAESCLIEPAGGYSSAIYGFASCTIKNVSFTGPSGRLAKSMSYGLYVKIEANHVIVAGDVDPQSSASNEGIKAGDRILAIDGEQVKTDTEVLWRLKHRSIHSPDKAIVVDLESMGIRRTCRLVARLVPLPPDVPALPCAIVVSEGKVGISGCLFSRFPGGAVRVSGGGCKATITDNRFSYNSAGIVAMNGASVDITGNRFEKNEEVAILLVQKGTQATIAGNQFDEAGVCIRADTGAECTVAKNVLRCSGERADLICHGVGTKMGLKDCQVSGGKLGGIVIDGATMTVEDSEFDMIGGGALVASGAGSVLNVARSKFKDCPAASIGIAVRFEEGARGVVSDSGFDRSKSDAGVLVLTEAVHAAGKGTVVEIRGNTFHNHAKPIADSDGAEMKIGKDNKGLPTGGNR